jgi:hypothetical protein
MAIFEFFGISVTLDFSPPLTEEEVSLASERYEQAKADGDTVTRPKIGTRLLEKGYAYNPAQKAWYPMPTYCDDDK